MLSELQLNILENPDINFIKANLSEPDKIRIQGWFLQHVNSDNVQLQCFEKVLEIFLWCCFEGEDAADTQDPFLFGQIFGKKADEIGLTIKELSSLFFSHKTLFEIQKELPFPVNSSRGSFIVLEGLDGSGKSTQIKLLSKKLELLGRKVYCTAEPTNSATGGLIRDALSHNYQRDATELAALFLTDRITHNINPIWGIKKFLNEGIDVICDRYYYSSFAYQGLETDLKWILDMNTNCPEIIKPDICIFLDADYKTCKSRVDSERVHLESYEENENIMRDTRTQFYEVFKLLNEKENIQIVDANRPLSIVADEIYKIVMNFTNINRM